MRERNKKKKNHAKGGRGVIHECGSHMTAMARMDMQHKPWENEISKCFSREGN